MSIFEKCHVVNDLLIARKEGEARNELILLLDEHAEDDIPYSPLVNHLIRETGLYPYMQMETADWQDRLAYEAFKVPTSTSESHVLHRDQSLLLRHLLDGENIAVSAPTSFGKSFVIDAFISITKPKNVVIIVPTVALTDETRRRLYRKFAREYKIITTTDVELADRNIFIFPQERAINYVNEIEEIDMLIVDEFYKSSTIFDNERAPTLLRAILKLGKKAKQRYFLAPNISHLSPNPFTQDMVFLRLDLNTVFLKKFDLYEEIQKDEAKKNHALLDILNNNESKSLIYAGTYANIDKIATLLIENHKVSPQQPLHDFSEWLSNNYAVNWNLTNLVKRGTGIHNGQLHRSLSQIQVRLFAEDDGLSNLISTSSIIEGVNTSAENVIIWMNKNGRARLNDFTYKNIIGRGGRMFRHFVGKIYILDAPPAEEAIQLDIPLPDQILGGLDEEQFKAELNDEQISKIIAYREEMQGLLGAEAYNSLVDGHVFQTSDAGLIKQIVIDMKRNSAEWAGLGYLNSEDPEAWERFLYKVIKLQGGVWGTSYRQLVAFIKVLSQNWQKAIPELLDELDADDIGIDAFFKLERNVSFLLASLLDDVNTLHKLTIADGTDISPFVFKVSHAFLPKIVFQLEEFGLPRMLSRRIYNRGLIDFEDSELTLHGAIEWFNDYGKDSLCLAVQIEGFDRYIVDFFYDGITTS